MLLRNILVLLCLCFTIGVFAQVKVKATEIIKKEAPAKKSTSTLVSGFDEETKTAIAKKIAKATLIFDGHIDLPYRLTTKNFRLTKEFLGIPIQSDEGDFDYVRAKEGGLDAPFMSIYIPASYQKEGGAKDFTDSLITMVEGIVTAHPDNFALAPSTKSVMDNFAKKKISLPMGMENGAPIEDDIKNVKHFYDRGIRYITLTHSKDNQICDSSYDTTRTWNGLSPFGEKVVAEMNNVGIMIDISHVSDSAYYDVLKIVKAPVIASHSSVRKFTPGFERNMNDEMLRALAKNGGVIMINFGSTFLDGKLRLKQDTMRQELSKILKEKGLSFRDEAAKSVIEEYAKNSEGIHADIELVADHIDHVVRIVGVDHVGFGSDYDGVGDTLPKGLEDVSDYPNLIKVLLDRGYNVDDIKKICSGNLMRVWKEVEKVAAMK